MDAFTGSEKATSMAVVVARLDSDVAARYIVSCEIVYAVRDGGFSACADTGKRTARAIRPTVRMRFL